jgi:hypothetical protein
MKLYTEEQVRSLLNKMDIIYSLEDLTPIELPSDEEIKKYIESTPYYGTCTYEFKEGIEDGIKWMKKQILNKNK